MNAPEFFLFLPQMRMSLDALAERARVAELHGFSGCSLMDHLAPPGVPHTPVYDGLITAAMLATTTAAD